VIDFSPFWCCLASWERDFLIFMSEWSAFPDPVVYKTTYDATWLSLVGDVDTDLYNWWANTWEISFVDVEVIPGLVLPGATYPISLFISLGLWLLDDASTCPELCRYTSGFFSLPS